MHNSVNLTVVGNVIADPELSQTRGGVPFATFRVASTSRRFDREAAAWVNGETLYLQVRCWRGLAASVAGTLAKGSPVVVHGRLVRRSVTGDGPQGPRRRDYTDLDATAIGLDLARIPSEAAKPEAA
jgi:single-strand DNA-binding protein